MKDLLEQIEPELHDRFREIVAISDAFCDKHLNAEYKDLAREMVMFLCEPESPLLRGNAASWACGAVAALGFVNFLGDPSTKPYMRQDDVARGFGISPATLAVKSKVFRDSLQLCQFHPDWCLPSLLDANPLAWMIETPSGFIVDARTLPRPLQEQLAAAGRIPYVPEPSEPQKEPPVTRPEPAVNKKRPPLPEKHDRDQLSLGF